MNPTDRVIFQERRVKLFFFLGSLVLLFLLITKVDNLLVSFLLAFVGYYLLAPIVDLLERKNLSRLWATTLPFLVLSLFGFLLVSFFSAETFEQIKALQNQYPQYLDAANKLISQLEALYKNLLASSYGIEFIDKIKNNMADFGQTFLTQLPQYLSKSLTVTIMTPFLTFFMLLDGRQFVT